MKIREIMTSPAVTLSPNDSIQSAAENMKTHNIGALPVVENEKPVGILTDRDIIVRAVAQSLDARHHTVDEIMTRDPDTVSAGTDVHEATNKMAKDRVRRLPVTENGRIVGVVTLGDMAECRCLDEEVSETLTDISSGKSNHCK